MIAYDFTIAILVFVIVIGIYVGFAMFLNKFNQLVYNKKTALAWIPICNIYLLGKLAVNKIVGYVLVILVFLNANYTVTVNGVSTTYKILPGPISNIFQIIYDLAIIVLLIYAIVKYNKLKKAGESPVKEQETNSQSNENNI